MSPARYGNELDEQIHEYLAETGWDHRRYSCLIGKCLELRESNPLMHPKARASALERIVREEIRKPDREAAGILSSLAIELDRIDKEYAQANTIRSTLGFIGTIGLATGFAAAGIGSMIGLPIIGLPVGATIGALAGAFYSGYLKRIRESSQFMTRMNYRDRLEQLMKRRAFGQISRYIISTIKARSKHLDHERCPDIIKKIISKLSPSEPGYLQG